MQCTWISLAALALAISADCHMIMLTPTPFNNETIDNSPLDSSGSNYPCKSTGSADFYNANGIKNTMAVGESQTLSFRGSAVHGGGSCQLAITTDKAPTASTSWSVIQSIEGGCPSIDGTAPSTYQYSIPEGVPPGDYVFAWTWVSKESGGPEYYMNCAPITVTAAASKLKAKRRTFNSKRDAMPNLAVFNLASVNECKSTLSSDPTYADPGPNLVKPPGTRNYSPISGTNCFPKGASAAGDLSGGSAGGSSGAASGSASAAASGAAAAGTAGAGSAAPSSPAGGAAPSSPAGAAGAAGTAIPPSSSSIVATPVTSGGVTAVPSLSFPGAAPISSPAAASGAGAAGSDPAQPSASPQASPSDTGSSGADGGSPSLQSAGAASPTDGSDSSQPTGDAASPVASPSAAASAGTSSGGTSGGLTGPCTDEGIYNCIGGSTFQRCASGQWSALIAMPGGTTCQLGQSQGLWARTFERAVRRYRRNVGA